MTENRHRERAAERPTISKVTASAETANQPSSPRTAPSRSASTARRSPGLAEAVMAKVRNVDLDALSREEAIELGTQITHMFRAMGYADLSSEDYTMLSELMRKLTGRR